MAEYIKKEDLKFLEIPIAPVIQGEQVHYEQGFLKEWLESVPTADVIERSTMEILCNEYLSKCNCCDECCAETYCILNSLRTENRDCVNNLITYFTKRNIGE